MIVFKKQITEAIESRLAQAQKLADDQQVIVVIVVSQYSARKYSVNIQLAAHRPGVKVGDSYLYDGQEMTVEAVIIPTTKEQPEAISETSPNSKAEFYKLGTLTRQDCVNASNSGQEFYKIRTTERGVEILDRRPLAQKLTTPIKNVLANFGDDHYLVSEGRYQELLATV